MLLVCRTPTGYFSTLTDATNLTDAMKDIPGWFPKTGTLTLEEPKPTQAISWPVELMVMWLDSRFTHA